MIYHAMRKTQFVSRMRVFHSSPIDFDLVFRINPTQNQNKIQCVIANTSQHIEKCGNTHGLLELLIAIQWGLDSCICIYLFFNVKRHFVTLQLVLRAQHHSEFLPIQSIEHETGVTNCIFSEKKEKIHLKIVSSFVPCIAQTHFINFIG